MNRELREECIRLRIKERKSLREIHLLTGAPKGTLSGWLKEHPLTEAEKKKRRKRKADLDRQRTRKPRGDESRWHRAIDPKALSRFQKAKISEAAVLFRATLFGFNPFGSVFDGDKADWILEVPQTQKMLRVQVRWCKTADHGLPLISLTCVEGHNNRRRFKKGEFDFIVGYDLYTDICYVFSEEETAHLKTTITVTTEAAEAWDKLKK